MRWTVLTIVIVAMSGSSVYADDVVEYFTESGAPASARGSIREESPLAVVVQTTTGQVQVPVNRIDSIKYDRQPPQLSRAASDERLGRYEASYDAYKAILDGLPEGNARLDTAVAFAMLRCACGAAVVDPKKADRSLTMYAQSRKQFRKTRHYYPMHEWIGRVYLAKGDFDKAAEAFSVLKEVDWPGYKEKATVYQGISALRQKDFPAARLSFDEVINSTSNDPESVNQRYLAKIFKGELLAQTNKAGEAEQLLRQALNDIPVDESYAKAIGHNALGDALVAAGKPKNAIIEGYLWVPTIPQYRKHSEQMARSLYHLSKLLPLINKQEQAEQFAAMLRNDYAESEWAKKLDSK